MGSFYHILMKIGREKLLLIYFNDIYVNLQKYNVQISKHFINMILFNYEATEARFVIDNSRSQTMENVEVNQNKGPAAHHDELEISVGTTSGAYPKKGQKKAKATDLVAEFLAGAQKHLHLTDTSNWAVTVGDKEINPNQTFAQNGLHDTVVMTWGPRHGGGG